MSPFLGESGVSDLVSFLLAFCGFWSKIDDFFLIFGDFLLVFARFLGAILCFFSCFWGTVRLSVLDFSRASLFLWCVFTEPKQTGLLP